MVTDDNPIADLPQPEASNSDGWRKRLTLTLVGCLACVALIAAVADYSASARRGTIVFPPEMRTMLPVLSSGSAHINEGLIEYYGKKYGFIDCVIGTKLGALCQDGHVDYNVGATICATNCGVKAWIECR